MIEPAMTYQEHPINQSWSDEEKIDLYRQMVRIRGSILHSGFNVSEIVSRTSAL